MFDLVDKIGEKRFSHCHTHGFDRASLPVAPRTGRFLARGSTPRDHDLDGCNPNEGSTITDLTRQVVEIRETASRTPHGYHLDPSLRTMHMDHLQTAWRCHLIPSILLGGRVDPKQPSTVDGRALHHAVRSNNRHNPTST